MPTKNYEGHKFKFHLLAKVEAEDDSTAVRLFARVDLKNKRPGFFDDMWVRPLKNNEWKSYTIEGTIDSNGVTLVWGLVPQFNGNFYFDDVKIVLKSKKISGVLFFLIVLKKILFNSDFRSIMKSYLKFSNLKLLKIPPLEMVF